MQMRYNILQCWHRLFVSYQFVDWHTNRLDEAITQQLYYVM